MTDKRLQELTSAANLNGLTRDEAGELFSYIVELETNIVELETNLHRMKTLHERNYEYLNTKMARIYKEVEAARERIEDDCT